MSDYELRVIEQNREKERQTKLIADIELYIKHFFSVYNKNDRRNVETLNQHIIKLINLDPELYTAQNIGGQNLGMICAGYGLEKVVLHVLENYAASVQQDCVGQNLGMYAAENNMDIAVLKALDNNTASLQVDNRGENIGHKAAQRGMRRAILKAIQNKKAACQQDKNGYNIGMICAKRGFVKETWNALDNDKAAVQQNDEGMNIGMLAAAHCNVELKTDGEMEKAVCKALDNKKAAKQQDNEGNTIGIYAISNSLPLASERAISNPEARVIKNNLGKSMEDYYHMNKHLVRLLLEKYDRELIQGK